MVLTPGGVDENEQCTTRTVRVRSSGAIIDDTLSMCVLQGSDTRVRTQKNPVGFFGCTHRKKTRTSTLT